MVAEVTAAPGLALRPQRGQPDTLYAGRFYQGVHFRSVFLLPSAMESKSKLALTPEINLTSYTHSTVATSIRTHMGLHAYTPQACLDAHTN